MSTDSLNALKDVLRVLGVAALACAVILSAYSRIHPRSDGRGRAASVNWLNVLKALGLLFLFYVVVSAWYFVVKIFWCFFFTPNCPLL